MQDKARQKSLFLKRRHQALSSTCPDWSREKPQRWWDPSRQLLRSIRAYQKWYIRGGLLGSLICKISVIQHRFWSIVTSSDIPINACLGGGLVLRHPNGIVIHPAASVGPNCVLLQQTTLVEGVQLGGAVKVLAGAKIVRPVVIGDHAVIGANAVVLEDVPPKATAVGVPARIITNESNKTYRWESI